MKSLCRPIQSQSGAVLAAVLIVNAAMVIVLTFVLGRMANSTKTLSVRVADEQLRAALSFVKHALQDEVVGLDALRSSPTTNLTLSALAVGSVTTVNNLYLGTNDFTNWVDAHYSRLEIQNISFRITSLGPASTITYMGGPVSVTRVNGDLEMIVGIRTDFMSKQVTEKIPVHVLADTATRLIYTSSRESLKNLTIGIAVRNGLTIPGYNCDESFPERHLDGDPACVDANHDGFCEPVTFDMQVASPHPATIALVPPSWLNNLYTSSLTKSGGMYVPGRTSGTNRLTTQQEGRCLVDVISLDPAVDPDDVFVTMNGVGPIDPGAGKPFLNGFGCNNTNGWFVVSCTRSATGLESDADATIHDWGAVEWCATDDWNHVGSLYWLGWTSFSVSLTVTCGRYE